MTECQRGITQLKVNFPELVCHCEPVTDVTGVAIPIDTQNGH